jgi:hypothetical protein
VVTPNGNGVPGTPPAENENPQGPAGGRA